MRKGRIPQLQGDLLFVLRWHFSEVYGIKNRLQEFRVIPEIPARRILRQVNLPFDFSVFAMALDAMTRKQIPGDGSLRIRRRNGLG